MFEVQIPARGNLDQDIGKIDVDIRTSGLGIRPKVSLEFWLSISSLRSLSIICWESCGTSKLYISDRHLG